MCTVLSYPSPRLGLLNSRLMKMIRIIPDEFRQHEFVLCRGIVTEFLLDGGSKAVLQATLPCWQSLASFC